MKFKGAVKSKLPKTGSSIFAIMSGLAQETGAINLSQGFPDFRVSAELIGLVNKNMLAGHNQYAPMPGVRVLGERIAGKIRDMYDANYDIDKEITITAGGTQAIFTAITSIIREGDEVIVFEPAYDCYVPAIELNGGIPVQLSLITPGYKIDWEHVRKIVTPRTKAIIINSPHNPTGTVLTEEDMQHLEKITNNTEIVIISDEVYEHVIFDGMSHQSIMRYPKLAERSFVIFSFGKTFHATGWKTGYCVAPETLTAEFRKIHQFMVFATNTPMQYALAEYMSDKKNYSGISEMYQKKRDYFASLIKASKFKLLPCNGSYFQLLDYSLISNAKDTDYAIHLTKEFGVASIPISVFYKKPVDNKILRFCFAKEDETLRKAAERLCKI